MPDFSYPPNDPDTLDPADFVADPWTDPNGNTWLYVASPGYWASADVASGGASAWADLTDKATAPLPTDNTALAAALAAKLATSTAASTYAPISTTVATSGTQTVNGTKTFGSLATNGTVVFGAGTTFFADTDAATSARSALATNDAANITTGNIAVARIATALATPGAIGGTTPAAISATTVTASGAVALTGANRITFGGTSSTYVALKYSSFSSGRLAVRLADDSAYAQINTSGIEVFNGSNRAVQFGINMGGGIGGMGLSSEMRLVWASTSSGSVDTNIGASTDTGITRILAGLLGVGTGGAGSFAGSVKLTNLEAVGTIVFGSYTVGTVPSAATYVRGLIYVSDESGGATLAYSNGSAWKRVYDNANIS
jgi:hypothetical protein